MYWSLTHDDLMIDGRLVQSFGPRDPSRPVGIVWRPRRETFRHLFRTRGAHLAVIFECRGIFGSIILIQKLHHSVVNIEKHRGIVKEVGHDACNCWGRCIGDRRHSFFV